MDGAGQHCGENYDELKRHFHLDDSRVNVELMPIDVSLIPGATEKLPLVTSPRLCKNHSCTKASGNGHLDGPMQCICERRRVGNAVCKMRKYICQSLRHVVFGTKLNSLLLAIPLAVVAVHLHFGHRWVFLLSLLGMAPLAERLGFVTEQLSFFTGSTVGGLLNATFGNATEMIICIFALRNDMIRVVQLSLLGSILSNMLLVLGCAFFFGGLAHRKKDQKFNKAAAQVSSGLLLMAVMGLLFPAALQATRTELHVGKSELSLSRFSSCIMLLAYACYLYFQLRSHRELYNDLEEDVGESDASSEEEECLVGFWASIFWLAVLTVFISILSEYLVGAIEGASESWNVPISFLSVVVLPIVGNAAEHASAIMFALKDKLDISLGVAIGSSTQISMFVIPFCVVIGWPMGTQMDLNFQLFETATLFITVLVVAFMLQGGDRKLL